MQSAFTMEELVRFGRQLLDPNPNFRNQRETAFLYAAKLFQSSPDQPDVLALLASHFIRQQEWEKALTMLGRGLIINPGHAELLRQYYHAQRASGDHASAADTLMQLYNHDAAGQQIKKYLNANAITRVVLGPGEHYYDGWLNLDLIPNDERFVWFDARAPLWLPDACTDIIFSEHMIEHITYDEGVQLLTDIYRVLKPGGRVRIATPDLTRTCSLANENRDETQQNYIDYINQTFGGHFNNQASFVINNMFFTYNHAFVYDEATLTEAMQRAGFIAIKRHLPRHSDTAELRNLEMHHLLGHDWLEDYQTLVLEARKPG